MWPSFRFLSMKERLNCVDGAKIARGYVEIEQVRKRLDLSSARRRCTLNHFQKDVPSRAVFSAAIGVSRALRQPRQIELRTFFL
jgi:hypothetical protein